MQSELAPISNKDIWPIQFESMTDYAFDEISRFIPDFDENKSRLLAVHLIARLAREYGGTTLYIPKFDAIGRAIRNRCIVAEFDGTPTRIRELAKRYGVSEMTVYNVVRSYRNGVSLGSPRADDRPAPAAPLF